MRLGWLAIALALFVTGCGKELPPSADSAEGYDRVVLAELFTAVWCGNCSYAEEALDRLYGEERARLAVLHWHPSFGQGDPFAIPLADERVAAYQDFFGGQMGVPLAVFNGVADIREGSPATYGRYRTRFDLEAAQDSPARIALEWTVEGDRLTVAAQVSRYPGDSLSAGRDLELFVVLAEHRAVNPGPVGADSMSYVARAGSSESIQLASGELLTRSFAFALDPSWKRADLHIVAFLQEPPSSSMEQLREVIQAAMEPLFGEEEDFYAFHLAAAETAVGIALTQPRWIPFTIANTGTLDDSLTIDLPLAQQNLPKSWTVELTDATGGSPSDTPLGRSLDVGETIGDLRISVVAPSAGEGTLALTVSSSGDPALADTLIFQLAGGTYGFDFSAAGELMPAIAGRTEYAPLELVSTATLDDSVTVSLPVELRDIPDGWEIALAGESGTTLAAPVTLTLPAGGEAPPLQLKVTPSSEGEGSAGVVARSLGQPSLADTLFFEIRARVYDLALSAAQTAVRVVVGTPARVPLTLENRGSRDDLVILELPAALQSTPAGWEIALVYGDSTEIALPYWLLVESGQMMTPFGLRVTAPAPGTAQAVLVARSTGDPLVADTLTIHLTAEQYGLEVSAPGGSTVDLELEVPALIPARIENTGTLNDVVHVDAPTDLRSVPDGWEVFWADADSNEIPLPQTIALAAGEANNEFHLLARATGDGTASIGLVAASTGLPELADTLILTLRASSMYRFELSAEQTEIEVAVGEFGLAPFELANTGSAEDEVRLEVGSLASPHPWETPVLCQGGTCYGPWIDVGLQPGETVSDYYVDMRATSAATVRVRLTATSHGNPAFSRSLTFTFVASAKAVRASAQAEPAAREPAVPVAGSSPAPGQMATDSGSSPTSDGMASP